jgi:hypothetical protein
MYELFKEYRKTTFMKSNIAYYDTLEKQGYKRNLSIPNIELKEMKDFLNNNYTDLVCLNGHYIVPFASCSIVSGNIKLKEALSKYFKMKVYTIYGYVKTDNKEFHKFSDNEIYKAVNKKEYFDNHHAWLLFENGQLLDLTFVNTVKILNNSQDEVFEFILSESSSIHVPHVMNLQYNLNSESYFKYIPLFYGDLFSEELLIQEGKLRMGL